MATVRVSGPIFKIKGSNDYVLTDNSNESDGGGLQIHIVNDGTLSATVTVKAESNQVILAGATDSFQAIPYRSLNVNGTVGTGAFVSTAITTDSIIFVPTMGLRVVLSVAFTSGSASVYVTPVVGSGAI